MAFKNLLNPSFYVICFLNYLPKCIIKKFQIRNPNRTTKLNGNIEFDKNVQIKMASHSKFLISLVMTFFKHLILKWSCFSNNIRNDIQTEQITRKYSCGSFSHSLTTSAILLRYVSIPEKLWKFNPNEIRYLLCASKQFTLALFAFCSSNK